MTRRACVIGWPVEHSRSPVIHGYWLKKYGIDGTYGKEAVRPHDFENFVTALADRGYAGANVTLPHKEAALYAADCADAAATAIGAANTLWFDSDGRLNASNTDAYGFMTNLEATAPKWRAAKGAVLVLGAGGAARAVLHGLAEAGAPRILLANRTKSRADKLAAAFDRTVDVIDWGDRNEAIAQSRLLVNTTTLGMAEQPALDVDLSGMTPSGVVADIVYVPLETPLLAAARARGLTPVDGLGMLLHQAVPGFERWFGVRPEVTADLKAHVMATLGPS